MMYDGHNKDTSKLMLEQQTVDKMCLRERDVSMYVWLSVKEACVQS